MVFLIVCFKKVKMSIFFVSVLAISTNEIISMIKIRDEDQSTEFHHSPLRNIVQL